VRYLGGEANLKLLWKRASQVRSNLYKFRGLKFGGRGSGWVGVRVE
jgi:hypothetical protein